jgi:NADH-quinone oxidoreductase subunit J
MTPEQIVFIIVGLITLTAAIMVVASNNLVHAGLWLILTLAGVAVLFILLQAGFLAVVQVAVYIDAIAIMIIIVVMLTRRAMRETERQVNLTWPYAALAALIIFGVLLALLLQSPGMLQTELPQLPDSGQFLEDLGQGLVDPNRFVLPFEVASILLVAALIGAIVVAVVPRRKGIDQ